MMLSFDDGHHALISHVRRGQERVGEAAPDSLQEPRFGGKIRMHGCRNTRYRRDFLGSSMPPDRSVIVPSLLQTNMLHLQRTLLLTAYSTQSDSLADYASYASACKWAVNLAKKFAM